MIHFVGEKILVDLQGTCKNCQQDHGKFFHLGVVGLQCSLKGLWIGGKASRWHSRLWIGWSNGKGLFQIRLGWIIQTGPHFSDG